VVPLPATACSQPTPAAIAAAFDLAANGQLSAPYPQLPASAGIHTIPPSVLAAVGWVESNWRQFTPQGRPLVSFDFGYGIMQITSGMAGAFGSVEGSIDPTTQSMIASSYAYNIAYGARMLAQKWASTPRIATGDPTIVEDWYYALWAYNGWGWVNNPNNPRFSRTGTPATNPSGFPYQERVLYLVAHPPKDADGNPLWQPVSVTLPSPKVIGKKPGPIVTLDSTHRQRPLPLAATYKPGVLGTLSPGARATVAVKLTNTGTQVWPAVGPASVTLTYHVFTMSGNPFKSFSPFSTGVLAFGQGALPLGKAVLPGASITVRETVQAPQAPGQYRIVWDLEEGVEQWFSGLGALPRVERLNVIRTGSPTPRPTASPTSTPPPREQLLYVADTSIPDGSAVNPREVFSKGWLVFNAGTVTWGSGYVLRHVSGATYGKSRIQVPSVQACRSGNVVASLKAPSRPGRYTGVWRMQDSSGHAFGDKLTVVVNVRGGPLDTPTPPAVTPTPTPQPRTGPTVTPTPAG
jgi:hypothetical protein